MKKKIVSMAVVSVFLLSAMPWTQLITPVGGFPKIIHVAGLTPHDPILITCNADFTAANGVTGGSGTARDPYVIEDWEIKGGESDSIHIKDTNAFFVIRNVWVHDGQFGMMFKNMTNGAVNNCTVTDHNGGIRIWYSSNNIITGNELFSNRLYGIMVDKSSDNTVSGNKLSFNRRYGIALSAGFNNTITGNNASSNDRFGMLLYESSKNNISGNNITANGFEIKFGSGVIFHYSFENIVSGNNISSNKHGLYLYEGVNNIISRNDILNNEYGIILYHGSENIVSGNDASSNKHGLYLYETTNNTISCNYAPNNEYGIVVDKSSDNTIFGNNVSSTKRYGIRLQVSPNNLMYHNNFANNSHPVFDDKANRWDSGYPSGGNYWSNYPGLDANCDGVGDTPFVISAESQDRFPLMGPFNVFDAGTWEGLTYRVELVSNSTVSDFDFSPHDKLISFNVAGPNDTVGFCRVAIPNTLLGGPYDVLVNGSPPSTLNEQPNGNNTLIHFTYNQSTKHVEITGTTAIREFPLATNPPLIFAIPILVVIISIVIILIAIISKRRRQ